jgi:hypothetical protein
VRAAIGEELLAGAEDGGKGQQPVFIDQFVGHQRVYDAQAAGDEHVAFLAFDGVWMMCGGSLRFVGSQDCRIT